MTWELVINGARWWSSRFAWARQSSARPNLAINVHGSSHRLTLQILPRKQQGIEPVAPEFCQRLYQSDRDSQVVCTRVCDWETLLKLGSTLLMFAVFNDGDVSRQFGSFWWVASRRNDLINLKIIQRWPSCILVGFLHKKQGQFDTAMQIWCQFRAFSMVGNMIRDNFFFWLY